jgi:hypothetical protein
MTAKFAKGNARNQRTSDRSSTRDETSAPTDENPVNEGAEAAAPTEPTVVDEGGDLETTAGDAADTPEPPAENPAEETTNGAQ